MRAKIAVGMNAASCDRHDARAEMARAGDVIRRVANHDELFRRKVRAEMLIDSLCGNGGKVATIEGLVAKRARELKELREAGNFQLEIGGGLYVAGKQGGKVARMFVDSLQDFSGSRHSFDYV